MKTSFNKKTAVELCFRLEGMAQDAEREGQMDQAGFYRSVIAALISESVANGPRGLVEGEQRSGIIRIEPGEGVVREH